MADIYVANTNGWVHVGDEDVQLRRGITRVREGHPLLKQAPQFFDPIDVEYEVEQSTASPGEKRQVRQAPK